ncbi:MAG: DUF447 domain-containing protein [Phycisphaeraceae bacterium]
MPKLPLNSRLIEGIVTTIADADPFAPASRAALSSAQLALVNIAPMGPIVDAAFETLLFRPFTSSTTYRNLKATGQGVFHVTDDALLIARAAIGKVNAAGDEAGVMVKRAEKVIGVVLAGACRAHEFIVTKLDDSQERTHIEAKMVHVTRHREFLGFNRAKHAVLEAAILATRLQLTGTAPVLAEFAKLQVIVDKTGAEDEHQAMKELRAFVESSVSK